ncbi:Glutathione peroxidase [Popillia japonica]|uniref:Glutathione peroxidase n=1 Tax=Popillia japonica TaxID=7064 RepID=A0AAW1LJ76_POPJA
MSRGISRIKHKSCFGRLDAKFGRLLKLLSVRNTNLLNFASVTLRTFGVVSIRSVAMAASEPAGFTNPTNPKEAKSIYEFTANDINGQPVSLEKYKGHVCIIVNVASQCGYTKNNYAELVELDEQFGESKGLKILGFPCNQFGGQEPGDAKEICSFVEKKNVKFDMFEKINVNGNNAHPLYVYLKHKQGGTLGDFIKWNFTKFIIDKNGQPVERHGPSTNPKDLIKSLEKYW